MSSFTYYAQLDKMDCGPTCLRMIAKYYGRQCSLQFLREKTGINREGVSLKGISNAAEMLGFRTLPVQVSFDKLVQEAPTPLIIHWRQNHFVVAYRFTSSKVFVADPAIGLLTYSHEEFLQGWYSNNTEGISTGIALLVEPTPTFYEQEPEVSDINNRVKFNRFFSYLQMYYGMIMQIVLGLIISSFLILLGPFLTQSIVDTGISSRNLSFINIILLAQFGIFVGRYLIDIIRGWTLLHISTRINVSILSDFFIKLLKLPITFFDTKHQGDLLQRIKDHERIETFMTGAVLNIRLPAKVIKY